MKEIRDQLAKIYAKSYLENPTTEPVNQLTRLLRKHPQHSKQVIQIYVYNLQQKVTNFLVQKRTYHRQQKYQEQIAELQNPENQIVIQNSSHLPTPEEFQEEEILEEEEEFEFQEEQEEPEQQEMESNSTILSIILVILSPLLPIIKEVEKQDLQKLLISLEIPKIQSGGFKTLKMQIELIIYLMIEKDKLLAHI